MNILKRNADITKVFFPWWFSKKKQILEYFNWYLQKSFIFDISYPGVGGYCNNRSEIEFGCLCPYRDFRRGGWCYDKTHNDNQYDMAIQHNEDLTNY